MSDPPLVRIASIKRAIEGSHFASYPGRGSSDDFQVPRAVRFTGAATGTGHGSLRGGKPGMRSTALPLRTATRAQAEWNQWSALAAVLLLSVICVISARPTFAVASGAAAERTL